MSADESGDIADILYMGQVPQDGNFGQNVALFKKKVEPSCDQNGKDRFDFSIDLG